MPRRPKLGQHFLRDSRIAQKIADLTPVEPEELLIEIGPGQGRMTRLLASRCRKLIAVELDPALAGRMQEEFRENPRIEILRRDVLNTSLATLAGNGGAAQVYVFGNLPYYITSPILHLLFGERQRIRRMTLLVQQEVAERITARPGSRDYGYLTVFVQSYSQPRIVLEVPSGAFSPPPKVRSALVDFVMARGLPAWSEQTDRRFQEFVRLCFREKRKNLLNNLAQAYPRMRAQEIIENLGWDQRIRAEQLSLEQFVALFERLPKADAGRG
ncbi:MAG TPA: 16S rRNA (adenine(1518)-N(6)/adenine(1519)-N(6))-dimethyltransferase RsmA [Terriglobia bacterium]|nr:16S rRNA (adenine(1518)-N(6)/adenine(1519)-N(6))-dimethyltransferase RsmA [Terriglobia bacterium]